MHVLYNIFEEVMILSIFVLILWLIIFYLFEESAESFLTGQ